MGPGAVRGAVGGGRPNRNGPLPPPPWGLGPSAGPRGVGPPEPQWTTAATVGLGAIGWPAGDGGMGLGRGGDIYIYIYIYLYTYVYLFFVTHISYCFYDIRYLM